jgi:hypothetical protein
MTLTKRDEDFAQELEKLLDRFYKNEHPAVPGHALGAIIGALIGKSALPEDKIGETSTLIGQYIARSAHAVRALDREILRAMPTGRMQ